jgi:hypothetical protein
MRNQVVPDWVVYFDLNTVKYIIRILCPHSFCNMYAKCVSVTSCSIDHESTTNDQMKVQKAVSKDENIQIIGRPLF